MQSDFSYILVWNFC